MIVCHIASYELFNCILLDSFLGVVGLFFAVLCFIFNTLSQVAHLSYSTKLSRCWIHTTLTTLVRFPRSIIYMKLVYQLHSSLVDCTALSLTLKSYFDYTPTYDLLHRKFFTLCYIIRSDRSFMKITLRLQAMGSQREGAKYRSYLSCEPIT